MPGTNGRPVAVNVILHKGEIRDLIKCTLVLDIM
jgi:hypothetical protein